MICKLLAAVPGERLIYLIRQLFRLLDERGDDRKSLASAKKKTPHSAH
jgi:hypothetical protein